MTNQGSILLRQDLRVAQLAVGTFVQVQLTDSQYGALCDFTYNVGVKNFRESTLLKVINQQEFPRVAFELRRWIKANGIAMDGLRMRREREIDLFFESTLLSRESIPQPSESQLVDIRSGE
jgi:lysozyme